MPVLFEVRWDTRDGRRVGVCARCQRVAIKRDPGDPRAVARIMGEHERACSPPLPEELELGERVYIAAGPDRIVRGTLTACWGAYAEIETEDGPRVVPARALARDLWWSLRDLP